MRYFWVSLCFAILFLACAGSASAAKYPWEKDAQAEKQESTQPVPDRAHSKNVFHFGPFLVDKVSPWMSIDHPEEGEILALLNSDQTDLETAISIRDSFELTDSVGSDRAAFEEAIIQKLDHQYKTRIRIAGEKDVLYMRDASGGQTHFYIFPYTADRIYVLAVVYQEEREKVSAQAKEILLTFRFAD